MIQPSRRKFVVASAATLAAGGLLPCSSLAQATWPTKPIHLVVTFAPGGVTDSATRLLSDQLARRLGQPVVIENRPGGAGNVGASYVAKSDPSGHTMVVVLEGTIVINPHVYEKMSYDPMKDLVPAGKIGNSTIVLVAHPSLGAKTLGEASALSKTRTGGLSYGTAGSMTITHIAGELMKLRTGANFVHIPYKGGGPAVADVLGGHIPLAFVSAASVQQHIRSGKLIALAVPSGNRSPALPDVPTFQETGIPNFDVNSWAGIFASSKTPQAVIERFNDALNAALIDPEIRERLATIGIVATPLKNDNFATDIRRELEWYGPLLKQSGLKPDPS